jgi:hypothetical protein
MKTKRENFRVPSEWSAFKCDDCGCIFEARLLRGKQNRTTTPHLEAWMRPVNNCCHCGGTMLIPWEPLTQREVGILSKMLERQPDKEAKAE